MTLFDFDFEFDFNVHWQQRNPGPRDHLQTVEIMPPTTFELKAQRHVKDIGVSDLEIYRAGDARAWAVLPIPLQDHEQPGYSSQVQGPAYWVITSPNVSTPMGIPEPPRYRRKVRARANGRYGADDPTLWPQLLDKSQKYIWAACCTEEEVPKEGSVNDDPRFWYPHTVDDLERAEIPLIDPQLYKLPPAHVVALEDWFSSLLRRLSARMLHESSGNSTLYVLRAHAMQAKSRLLSMPAPFPAMIRNLGALQIALSLLEAHLVYIISHAPLLLQCRPRPVPKKGPRLLGCFTTDLGQAEACLHMGIPVYVLRPSFSIPSDINVASSQPSTLLPYHNLLVYRDFVDSTVVPTVTRPFHTIYEGAWNVGMLDVIVGEGSVAWSLSSQGFKNLSASERLAVQEAVVDETSRYRLEREEIRRRRLLDSKQPMVTDVEILNMSLIQPFIPLGKKAAEAHSLIANPPAAPTLPFEGSSSFAPSARDLMPPPAKRMRLDESTPSSASSSSGRISVAPASMGGTSTVHGGQRSRPLFPPLSLTSNRDDGAMDQIPAVADATLVGFQEGEGRVIFPAVSSAPLASEEHVSAKRHHNIDFDKFQKVDNGYAPFSIANWAKALELMAKRVSLAWVSDDEAIRVGIRYPDYRNICRKAEWRIRQMIVGWLCVREGYLAALIEDFRKLPSWQQWQYLLTQTLGNRPTTVPSHATPSSSSNSSSQP
ncbi:hypothetical protein FISHEDRAFT_74108, partial [Fistulina hepatica ATCC 64428]